jgi:hypothetical protein
MKFIRLLVPAMSSFHHIDASSPEEDVVPLGQVMVSALYPTTFYTPHYMGYVFRIFFDFFPKCCRANSLKQVRLLVDQSKSVGGQLSRRFLNCELGLCSYFLSNAGSSKSGS